MSSANAPSLFMNGFAFSAPESRPACIATMTIYTLLCSIMLANGASSFGRPAENQKDEPHKSLSWRFFRR